MKFYLGERGFIRLMGEMKRDEFYVGDSNT